MSLRVEVMSMAQEMNLEDGSVSHFVLLRVGDKVVRALITEESAQIIVNAKFTDSNAVSLIKDFVDTEPSVIAASPPPPAPVPVNGMPLIETDDGVAAVFGGTVVAPKPPAAMPRQKIVRVEKDEWGYPKVHTAGGVDPGEVVGGHDQDEDGVGQI